MKGQKSILSFLQKPPLPGNQNPAGNLTTKQNVGGSQTAVDSSGDIRGTDTPPEKVPRPIFPFKATADDEENAGRSLFYSIKHKFVKVKDSAKSTDRNMPSGGNGIIDSASNKYNNSYECNTNSVVLGNPVKEGVINVSGSAQQGHKGCPLPVESNDDVIGPETPGTRPLVPRLKRILEDGVKFEDISDHSFLNNSKRVKFFQDSQAEIKKHEVLSGTTISREVNIFQDSLAVDKKHEVPFEMPRTKRVKCSQDSQAENKKHEVPSDMVSKFEWLDPAKIRDANRRRPGDPLYNARTLYIPTDALRKMSASQKQYWTTKSQYMDVVLFFKVGKFYELYELDAEIGHKELDWKMTMSGVGKCRQVGISESGIDDAVQKLLARGYKVGRMEQLETSEQAKSRGHASVIERKLVNVLTPSTLTGGNIGPHAVHLLALKEGESGLDVGPTAYGFAFVDCASLKFWVGSFCDDASCAALGALLMQVSPKEIIYENHGLSKEAQKALKKYSLAGSVAAQLSPAQPATDFVVSSEVRNVFQSKGYFKGSSNIWDHALHGVMNQDLALCALGGLASHLSRLMLDDALRNGDILPYEVYSGSLRMDGQTIVNLEIFSNNADGGTTGTLYNYLDNCVTSSGKRLLRKWICHPLKDVKQINCRLNLVEEFMAHSEIMVLVAQYLKKLPDLERFLGQIKAAIQASSLILLPLIGSKILKQRVKVFGCLIKGLRTGIDLLMLLQKEGNIVSALSKTVTLPILGGNDGLDKFLAQFEAAIDSDFPNYQDHDLKDSDAEILSILIDLFIEKATDWCEVILALNCIDVLRSFAATAAFSCGAMSRPVILPQSQSSGLSQESKGPILKIKGLWHPFALGENGGLPVPNDLYLGEDGVEYNSRTLLLTGPNMGGKSTLLRATCLAIILAQLGCYVPCESCTLSLVDIIFTRLGATDRIMTGESTFFIECTETASVLQNASQDSLVLLDELGRGTSTFDGYAIAYAVFRHLVEKVNCRLLFATHYHPLTKEFAAHPHVTLQHMACAFKPKSENSSMENQELVFLYRLSSGACPESYGMQVALMAGIPKHVVEAAYKAGQVMKRQIGESFRSTEQRSEFSTLHEDWLRTLLAVSKVEERISDNDDENDDVFDTLYCLWHELKSLKQRLSK